MKVIFLDTNGVRLGTSEYIDIEEILIPAVTGKYEMFIKHRFASKNAVSTWKIISLVRAHLVVEITLEEMVVPYAVDIYSKSQNKTPEDLLIEFGVVEVEFGFYSDLLNINGNLTKNNQSTGTLMTGEMHKKRPCIVLVKGTSTAQILPLTSNTSRINPKTDIAIDICWGGNLANRYNIPTYALIGMIQTVSYSRIFPPKSSNGKYLHSYNKFKLKPTDKNAIRTALANQYNHGVNAQLVNLKQKLSNINREKNRVFISNKENLNRLKENQIKLNELEQQLLQIGSFFDLGNDINTIMQSFKD